MTKEETMSSDIFKCILSRMLEDTDKEDYYPLNINLDLLTFKARRAKMVTDNIMNNLKDK